MSDTGTNLFQQRSKILQEIDHIARSIIVTPAPKQWPFGGMYIICKALNEKNALILMLILI